MAVPQDLLNRSMAFGKVLSERLQNPSKSFGIIGSPIPAKDSVKFRECLNTLVGPLATSGTQLTDTMLDVVHPLLRQYGTEIIHEMPTEQVPYSNDKYNYIYYISETIDNLLNPAKNIKCQPFVRVKNLIQNTMKSQNIDLVVLKRDIDAFLAPLPKDGATTREEEFQEFLRNLGPRGESVGVADDVGLALGDYAGGKSRRRRSKVKKTRKVRRM
jgi:hypothetical protein